MKNLFLISVLFLSGCSSIRMERPEPEIYEALKAENLFGTWENSNSRLIVACTGRITFEERRHGKVHNKDEGGKVSEVRVEDKQMTVSGLFGKNVYHYEHHDEDTLDFLVGRRADWMEHAKLVAATTFMAIAEPERTLRLKRKRPVDCDSEPQTLGEVFKDMGQKLKDGEFEVVEKP